MLSVLELSQLVQQGKTKHFRKIKLSLVEISAINYGTFRDLSLKKLVKSKAKNQPKLIRQQITGWFASLINQSMKLKTTCKIIALLRLLKLFITLFGAQLPIGILRLRKRKKIQSFWLGYLKLV